MFLTYRYRLLPSRRQHRALESILESQRVLYNAALEERIGAYRKAHVVRNYLDQTKALTEWRQGDDDARAIPVSLQRWTLKRLDDAYRAFFRRLKGGLAPGFPRFRGRARFDSFGFREFCGITLKERRLRFKGMTGSLRVHLHRPMPGHASIKGCTFTRCGRGWYVAFAIDVPLASQRGENRAVGLDLGITTFAALSDGGVIPSLRAARRADRRLLLAQRRLARKQLGGGNYAKARVALAREHAAIRRRRTNHLHQATARLVRDYDVIAMEALNVKALAASKLARDSRDASWGKFLSILRYKAACAGIRLVEVDKDDTSQICSGCQARVPKDLDERLHACPCCGLCIDRDLNAARNILFRAGVGPVPRNEAGLGGMRAGVNLHENACNA